MPARATYSWAGPMRRWLSPPQDVGSRELPQLRECVYHVKQQSGSNADAGLLSSLLSSLPSMGGKRHAVHADLVGHQNLAHCTGGCLLLLTDMGLHVAYALSTPHSLALAALPRLHHMWGTVSPGSTAAF